METGASGDGAPGAVIRLVNEGAAAAKARGETVGVLACDETAGKYRADTILSLGRRTQPDEIAHKLFAALREMDARGVKLIYAEAFPESGVGLAIMNRMNKAAGHHWLHAGEEQG